MVLLFSLCIVPFVLLLLQREKVFGEFSSNTSACVFFIFFFVITPIVTYALDLSYWGLTVDEDLRLAGSFVALLFVGTYALAYISFDRKRSKVNLLPSRLSVKVSRFKIYLLLFSVLFLQLYISDFSLGVLFVRDFVLDEAAVNTGKIFWLLNQTFFRSVPTILFLYLFSYRNCTNLRKIDHFLILLLMIFIASPTSVPRFLAACFYLPVIYVYFIKNNRINYGLLLLLSLLVLFPLLDSSRLFALSNEFSFSIADQLISNFTAGHLDAFQSIMMALKYDNFTLFTQIVGALFFFVPRSIWPEKPVGSGSFVADQLGLSFNNISMSWPAEWYLSFGILGLFIGAFLLAYLFIRFGSGIESKSRPVDYIFSVMFVPMAILVLRGDMLSAVSFTSGIYLACQVWTRLMFFKV